MARSEEWVRKYAEILGFLANLHDCKECEHGATQIRRTGKRYSWCMKYNNHIKMVYDNCVDRFIGLFDKDELDRMMKGTVEVSITRE